MKPKTSAVSIAALRMNPTRKRAVQYRNFHMDMILNTEYSTGEEFSPERHSQENSPGECDQRRHHADDDPMDCEPSMKLM